MSVPVNTHQFPPNAATNFDKRLNKFIHNAVFFLFISIYRHFLYPFSWLIKLYFTQHNAVSPSE